MKNTILLPPSQNFTVVECSVPELGDLIPDLDKDRPIMLLCTRFAWAKLNADLQQHIGISAQESFKRAGIGVFTCNTTLAVDHCLSDIFEQRPNAQVVRVT